MGCGWYRGAYYPAEALDRPALGRRPGRRARPRGDRRGRGDRHPARDHRRDRDGQAVAVAPQEERVHRAAARAARRTGLAITTHAVMSDVGLAQLDGLRGGGRRPGAGRHRPRRLVPVARPLPRDHRARRDDRVRLPRDELHAARAPRRGPRSSSCCCELLARGHAERILLSPGRLPRLRSSRATRATATPTWPRRSCRACARPACRTAEIRTITVDNPRRLLTIG